VEVFIASSRQCQIVRPATATVMPDFNSATEKERRVQ